MDTMVSGIRLSTLQRVSRSFTIVPSQGVTDFSTAELTPGEVSPTDEVGSVAPWGWLMTV